MILDSTLKLLSLIFTNTITKYDLYERDIDIKNIPIDDNNINLYDLIVYFNNEYLSFKKEYNNLEKLNIGKRVSPLFYKDNELVLCISYPTIVKDDLSILHIIDLDGKIKCTINNITRNNQYNKEVKLDETITRKYLDLFKKYNHVMRLYREVLNSLAISDATYSITTLMSDNSIIDDIDGIKFTISINPNITPKTRIDISVKFGDEIGIDESDSKLTIYDKNVNANTNDYLYILKNIYIHKMYTSMIPIPKSKEKTKILEQKNS